MGLVKEKKEKGFIRSSIENFWYYYKWPFLGGILIFFGVAAFMSLQIDIDQNVDARIAAVFSRPLTVEDVSFQSQLEKELSDVNGDGAKLLSEEYFYVSVDGKSESDIVESGKFSRWASYARGDLLMMDRINMERYISQDLWEPLENYIDISDIPKENLYFRDGVAVAVKLDDSQVLMDMKYSVDSVFAGVLFVPEEADERTLAQRENAVKMIEKLLVKIK